MRCLVCDSNDWENVDEYRELSKHKGEAVGMCICNKCGFVSYPSKYKTEDEIREYYKKDYRGGAPGFNNLQTGRTKINYHAAFLRDLMSDWQKEGKTAPVFTDVGAALGMVCNWVKSQFPDGDINGVELTETYKNVAYHEYGVELTDDIDKTKKYDLIMSYKVAEHMIDADKKIAEYATLLNEGGKLYISVPTWFNALANPGTGGFDLEYWYHPDHINCWSRIHFEEVLRKSGFKIIKTERLVYGDTYLCEVDESVKDLAPKHEDPKEIKAAMGRIKKAFDFMKEQKPDKALEQWGNFPGAWAFYYEKERDKLHKKHNGNGLEIAEVFCTEMVAACGDTLDTQHMAGDILCRYSLYPQAIEVYERILTIKETDIRALLALSNCFRGIAKSEPDLKKKAKLLLTARDICRTIIKIDDRARPEAYNWALRDEANISPALTREIENETNNVNQGV